MALFLEWPLFWMEREEDGGKVVGLKWKTKWGRVEERQALAGIKRNGGKVNDGCKRWRIGRGNVTVEELESSLNLVFILLSESIHQTVIGFRFTRRFFFPFLMHTRAMELAALSLHVSRIIFKCQLFSQDANETRTCFDGMILYTCLVLLLHYDAMAFRAFRYVC